MEVNTINKFDIYLRPKYILGIEIPLVLFWLVLPFSDRLNFCLKHNLIPFLNSITINDQTNMIAITSDLINEIKKKIPQVSSLNEVASIIDGFIYGQRRINEKNIRIVYGTKKQLLDFLWME